MRWLSIITVTSFVVFFLFWSVVAEPIPDGKEGVQAENLTDLILKNINYEAWLRTGVIEWSFREIRDHLWDRDRNFARLNWEDCISWIDLSTKIGRVKCQNQFLINPEAQEKLNEAWEIWANDSFWLNPLAKLRDEGTIRKIIETPNNSPSLLVTYQTGGVTPGDSYLWETTTNGRVSGCQMWVKVLPVGGMRFTWDGWIKLSTGAMISSLHEGFVSVHLTDIRAGENIESLYPNEDPFNILLQSGE